MAAIGKASAEIWLPNWLIVWPAQSLRKSGCRHSPPWGQRTSLLAIEALSVSVRRGGTFEARHRVHAVAVRDGEVVAAAGDPGLVCLFRSSAKPIQALPLVRARPDLDDQEIAIACASHRAEPAQIAAVRSLLERAPATEDDLECGEQEGRPPARSTTTARGSTPAFSPCATRAAGSPWVTASPSTRFSSRCSRRWAAAAKLPPTKIPTAVDGCGVVTFGMSLERMAASFAGLAAREGADRILGAMRAHPHLVGGEGSLDTDLMRTIPGWVAKGGAEGLVCAVAPDGTGYALKCEDGNPRPLRPALARFLDQDLGTVPVESSRGEIVGEVVVE